MSIFELYFYACMVAAGLLMLIGIANDGTPAHDHEEGAGTPSCRACGARAVR